MRNIYKPILPIILFTLLVVTIQAQEANSPLKQQFDELMEDSETFKQYKVIPITTLESLFAGVKDSTNRMKNQIGTLEEKTLQLESRVKEGLDQIQSLESELATSQESNNSISFLGIEFSKTTYNLLVWSIIVGLALIAAFVYSLFKRSNKNTQTYKKELSGLSAALDNEKSKAHEKQVKLKRDLQTALNTLHENGIRM